MAIQPIETRYAGHHFRSRLEARWAVLFDALNIRWEYEPQGYRVGPDRRPHLPYFWLPKEGLWVEVKGAESQLDVELLMHAALLDTGLPRPANPYVINEHETRILVLGPLGRGATRVMDKATKQHVGYMHPLHTAVTTRKATSSRATLTSRAPALPWKPPKPSWVATHPTSTGTPAAPLGGLVGDSALLLDDNPDIPVAEAYRAALSARFEHGQSGT